MFQGLDITLLDIEEGFEECFLTSELSLIADCPFTQRPLQKKESKSETAEVEEFSYE